VEDHALVREAMSQTFSRLEPGLECVEATCSEQAIALLEQHDDWDLAVVDLMLPDLNGISLLGIMAKRFPDVPAVVVSAFDDQASVRRAMRAGASGFVSKARSGDVLCDAVRKVLDGGVSFPEDEPRAAAGGVRSGGSLAERFGLTAAQSRVAELLGQGRTNREIADLLGLSEGTIKVHMSAIFRAMKVRNRAQALVLISRRNSRP
jgi:DNA-binding NarL/FixJ family response regulator